MKSTDYFNGYFDDRFVPANESIDLINVAFEQKYKVPQNVKKKHIKSPQDETITKKSFEVPDRITGRSAVRELPRDRTWNFVEVCVFIFHVFYLGFF